MTSYTKNFVGKGIKEGRLIDARETAKALGFDNGIALTRKTAALGVSEVVAAVVEALAAGSSAMAGPYRMLPFDDDGDMQMLVLEQFSSTEAEDATSALWTVVDIA